LYVTKVGTAYALHATATGLTAVNSSGFAITPAAATTLAFTTQPPATPQAGQSFAPAVTVQDTYGNNVTGSTATIAVALTGGNGATLNGTLSKPAAGGVAAFAGLSINTVGTGYGLQATSSGFTAANSSTFAITPAAAATLSFTTQPPATSQAGQPFVPVVTVLDAYNNTVTTSAATVSLALTNANGAALSGTASLAAASGVATFNGLNVTKVGTGYALKATATSLVAANSTGFSITPAAASKLVFLVSPGTSPADVALAPSPQVAVQDTYGNTVTSSTAQVTVALTSGALDPASTTANNAVNGVATFNNLIIDLVGASYQLSASSSGLTSGLSSVFVVTGQPVLTVAKSHPAGGVNAGTQVTFTVTYGNIGAKAATNVVIAETLPARLSFVSASGGGTLSSGVITWTIPSLAAHTTGQTVTFVGTVDPTMTEGGTITNSQLTIRCTESPTPVALASPDVLTVKDTQPPAVSALLPAAGAWSADTDTLITLNITDGGSGVDPASIVVSAGVVSHAVGNPGPLKLIPATLETIYSGAGATANPGGWSWYDASANPTIPGAGCCIGTGADYRIVFQPSVPFNFEDQVYVQVTGSDLAGNAMTPFVYTFTVRTRLFGCNVRVDDGLAGDAFPATATDASGNVWVAWERTDAVTQKGTIWLAERPYDAWKFQPEIQVTTNGDCHKPALAITPGGTIYVAYELHNEPIVSDRTAETGLVLTSVIGFMSATTSAPTSWTPYPVLLFSNFTLETAPAITYVNSTGTLYVAGVGPDHTTGVSQIGVATMLAGTGSSSLAATEITSNAAAQASPAIAQDAAGIVYLLWTSTADNNLYGADSSTAWATIVQVTNTGTAGSPAIATETSGNVLHFAWAATGGTPNPDIQYANTYATGGGWPTAPLALGQNVLDDLSASNAANPRIAVTGTTTSSVNARVFIVWQDRRSSVPGDTDILFVERKRTGIFGTNIRVSSLILNPGIVLTSAETNPALGLTKDGMPCVAWTDLRESGASHIYFASAMCPVEYGLLWPNVAPAGGSGTFTDSTNPHFTEVDITVPANALTTPRDIILSELHDPCNSCLGGTGLYADGSGLYLDLTGGIDEPLGGWVTLAIHLKTGVTLPSPLTVYRLVPPATVLDSWTWTTDLIRNVSYNSTTNVLTFQTMHLSSFGVGAPAASVSSSSGGGGGGCAMSPTGEPDLFLLLLPLAAIGVWAGTRLIGRRRSA
jgi:uncharacterized repeat protein (TIGR01451 family)